MKYLISVLLGSVIFVSCSTNDQSDTVARDDFITIEATVITDTADATIQTWYNGTYLPKLMENDGLKGAYRVKTSRAMLLDTTSNVDFISAYLTILMSSSEDALIGLQTCSQVVEAKAAMAAKYPAGQIACTWNVSYEKLKSWENESADKPMQFITMVPTIAAAGHEEEVNNWEMNKHVPDHMHSQNLSRVVRYKKIAGTGADVSEMPDYIELFYYADEAGFKAHNPGADSVFAAAEDDRAATWKNGELNIPWVYSGAIETETTR